MEYINQSVLSPGVSNWNILGTKKVKVYKPNGRPMWVDPEDIPHKLGQYYLASSESSKLNTDALKNYISNFNPTKINNVNLDIKVKDVDSFVEKYTELILVPIDEYVENISLNLGDMDINQSITLQDLPSKIRTTITLEYSSDKYTFIHDFYKDSRKTAVVYTSSVFDIFNNQVIKQYTQKLYNHCKASNYLDLIAIHVDGNKNVYNYSLLGFDYLDLKNKFIQLSQYINLIQKITTVEINESELQTMKMVAELKSNTVKPKKIPEGYKVDNEYLIGKYILNKIYTNSQKLNVQDKNESLHQFFNQNKQSEQNTNEES